MTKSIKIILSFFILSGFLGFTQGGEYAPEPYCSYTYCEQCSADPAEAAEMGIYLCDGSDPGVKGEGFGCCTFDLNDCIPAGVDPTDNCDGGIFMWCDYYEIGPNGEMICWDVFGQGNAPQP